MVLPQSLNDQELIYSNFIDSLKSPQTKKVYDYFLKLFMKYNRIDEADYASLFVDPEQKIKSYLIFASKKDYAKSHFTIMICALKNFYEMNDVDTIRWNKLRRFVGETRPRHVDRSYTHNELLALVQNSTLKMKAIILLMASSGIRIGSIPNLRVSHLERKGDLYKISVYEGLKGQGHYTTFCTPESARELHLYLEWRKRAGEPITKNSPLFRMDFDSKFHNDARNNIRPITLVSIRTNLHRLLVKTGLREVDHVNPQKRKDVKMSHGFRKFFVTQLVNADIHEVIIKKLSGHKLDRDMTFVYSKQTDDKLLEEYTRAIDALTINPENKLQRKVTELEESNNRLDRVLARVDLLEKELGIK